MWCPRQNCLNKADFKKKMDEKRDAKSSDGGTFSDDFKVALAAITSNDDYKAIEEQFFAKAGK